MVTFISAKVMFKLIAAVLFVPLLETECLFDEDNCFAEYQVGVCEPLSQCTSLVSEIRRAGSPMPLFMREKLEALNCGFRDKEPKVCCLPITEVNSHFSSDPNRVGEPAQSDNSINSVGSEDIPEEFTRRSVTNNDDSPPDIQDHPNLSLLPTVCGNIENDKIWGGNRTSLFEMPWMVPLSYNSDRRGAMFSCGGTLITKWHVLTAAHCVSFLGDTLRLDGVILGEYDVRTDPDCTTIEGERFCAPRIRNATIDRVIPHPGYTRQTLVDDVALIRLTEPADFNLNSIKPICLPITRALQSEDLVGRNGVVAGWGFSEEGLQSPVLLSVNLPIISTEECTKRFKGTRFTNKQICAGGVRDKDSCGGDSGGPLMYPGVLGVHGAQYVQRGIVSYGPKRCGIGGLPGVYTNIAHYMDWILDNISP